MVDFLAQYRVELAVEQHLDDLLSRGGTLGRVDEFRDMRILKGDPLDRVEIDAIIIGQNPAQPCAGRRREGADADTLAFEIMRRKRSPPGVVKRISMLKARQHHV